ncbi:hypothetical protein B7486_58170, partial [cyanobacterium TDX16]
MDAIARLWTDLLAWFFGESWVPRGRCGPWPPWLAATWMASNLVIAIAYFVIPASIFALWRHRRNDIPKFWISLFFVAFILLCGVTHLTEIAVFFIPAYPAYCLIYFLTAVVSGVTAWFLPGVVEHILKLPSREFAHAMNHRLQEQLAALRLAHEIEARQKEILARQVERLESMRRTGLWVADQKEVIDQLRGILHSPITPSTDE